ncbi:hypothetical protein [Aeromonas hydrophila]|uniref:hypothetical protein n=1 Tax=Aeromonas hydrophila TaxID=644 RepID=UPI000AD353C0|nr:hypothetical protein [Aeromonas hydrophila]
MTPLNIKKVFSTLSLLFFIHCAAAGDTGDIRCRIDFNVKGITNNSMGNFKFTATEKNSANVFDIEKANYSNRVYIPPREGYFYREIELVATKDDKVIGDIAYYMQWPCATNIKSKFTEMYRNGSAKEVLELWNSKDHIKPKDFETALFQYNQALGTAEKRLTAPRRGNYHQYDIISSYLALRAFNNLLNSTDIPIARSSRIEKIADWHIELLAKVNKDGLEPIFNEGASISSGLTALSEMYKKYWQHAKAIKEEHTLQAYQSAHDLFVNFRNTIELEPEKKAILDYLSIKPEEPSSSINELSGLWMRSSNSGDLTEEALSNIQQQTKTSENRLSNSNTANQKQVADIIYLNEKINNLREGM